MRRTAAEIEALVQREVPQRFLERTLGSLFVALDVSAREVRTQHDPADAHDVLGHIERSHLETSLRALGMMSGIDTGTVSVGNNMSRHTEFRTESLLLIAARVRSPGAVLHRASFMETAAWDGQMQLAGFGDNEAVDRQRVFGALAYTRSRWANRDERQKWGHLPGSLHLVFPDPTLTYYVWTMDLFAAFSNVVRQHTPQEWDEPMFARFVRAARRNAV